MSITAEKRTSTKTAAGLFAGVGGIELGLSQAGFKTKMICEIDPGAAAVLQERFGIEIEPDVRRMSRLPQVDVLAAGFPCQDLSQAGKTAGISGKQSGLITEVFKRLSASKRGPKWLLLENVPFMLQLQRGQAMRYLVDELERLHYTWAYRIVDTRSFGLPQRRRRVILLASRSEDPRVPLYGQDSGESLPKYSGRELCGFYWTEGLRGLGWAVSAIPTLKGGSALGIPSPPAIWDPKDGSFGLPNIADAERLQGFECGWTEPATGVHGVRKSHRWKLIGNAVSVPVSRWVGEQISNGTGQPPTGRLLERGVLWPKAAWGSKGRVYEVDISSFPVRQKPPSLRSFLEFPRTPLSHRAASGFLQRALRSTLNFEEDFISDLKRYVRSS